jgi:hypothetical protein
LRFWATFNENIRKVLIQISIIEGLYEKGRKMQSRAFADENGKKVPF